MNKHKQWPKVQALSYQLLIIAKKKKKSCKFTIFELQMNLASMIMGHLACAFWYGKKYNTYKVFLQKCLT